MKKIQWKTNIYPVPIYYTVFFLYFSIKEVISALGIYVTCDPFSHTHYYILNCVKGQSAVPRLTSQQMHNTHASWRHGNSLNKAPNLINSTTMLNQPDRKGLRCTQFSSVHSLRKCYDYSSVSWPNRQPLAPNDYSELSCHGYPVRVTTEISSTVWRQVSHKRRNRIWMAGQTF